MSQENVEQLRSGLESFLAGTDESAREEMLSRIAEGWDPEIELDASETPVLDTSGVYRGRMPLSGSGASGSLPGTPSGSSTSWLMPGTA
jgi:hypothetical protein